MPNSTPVQRVPTPDPHEHGGRASASGHPGPIKIVCVSSTAGFGGTEKHLIDLIRRLDPSKNEISIHCLKGDPYSEHLVDQSLPPVKVHSHAERFGLLRAWRAFAEEKPDVIFFINGRLGLFTGKVYLAAKLSGASKIVAIEQLMGPPYPPKASGSNWFMNRLRDLFGARARYLIHVAMARFTCDMTICVSNAIRNRLIKEYGYSPARTVTVWNGADTSEFRRSESMRPAVRQELKLAPGEILLLNVARLAPEKGLDVLLLAMKKLSDEKVPCQCVIVGDGPLEAELIRERDRLGLSGMVHFAGFRSDVKPYYNAADLFVLPSRNEGLPFVLVEAMAAGLPCIATNVGGNTEIVSDGEDGLIVPAESVDSLAAAIKRLVCDKQLREGMRERAISTACRLFDARITMGKAMDILGAAPKNQDAPRVVVEIKESPCFESGYIAKGA